jgi:ATP-dependent protease Clp ATPase subunit
MALYQSEHCPMSLTRRTADCLQPHRFTSRLPTITSLHPLTTSDLMRVLTEVRGALAKQYEALFGYSGVEIRFTTSALREICEMATKRGMGARGLRGIMVGRSHLEDLAVTHVSTNVGNTTPGADV